jgi:hypothetical protein
MKGLRQRNFAKCNRFGNQLFAIRTAKKLLRSKSCPATGLDFARPESAVHRKSAASSIAQTPRAQTFAHIPYGIKPSQRPAVNAGSFNPG